VITGSGNTEMLFKDKEAFEAEARKLSLKRIRNEDFVVKSKGSDK
jgi:hypothetical protein